MVVLPDLAEHLTSDQAGSVARRVAGVEWTWRRSGVSCTSPNRNLLAAVVTVFSTSAGTAATGAESDQMSLPARVNLSASGVNVALERKKTRCHLVTTDAR